MLRCPLDAFAGVLSPLVKVFGISAPSVAKLIVPQDFFLRPPSLRSPPFVRIHGKFPTIPGFLLKEKVMPHFVSSLHLPPFPLQTGLQPQVILPYVISFPNLGGLVYFPECHLLSPGFVNP